MSVMTREIEIKKKKKNFIAKRKPVELSHVLWYCAGFACLSLNAHSVRTAGYLFQGLPM